MTFVRDAHVLREDPSQPGIVIATRGSAAAVDGEQGARALRRGAGTAGGFRIGVLDGEPVYAVAAEPDEPVVGLRDLATQLPDDAWAAASLATQLVDYGSTTRFCGTCAEPRAWNEHDLGRLCPNGHETAYPRIAPCAIVLVHDGAHRVLLGKRANWPVNRYSLFAGFVEQGESVEECASREVLEEVGVDVCDLTYVGSQSWPFPSQLMLGYTARWASGEIRVDPEEIEDARWFDVDDLPPLPPPLSIARRILEAHVAAHTRLSPGDARAAARTRAEW
jgi:NAD+ diphosphatase